MEDEPRELAIKVAIARQRGRSWHQQIPKLAAFWELSRLVASRAFWTSGLPHGDGHSVLVVPGFGAGDIHYFLLRNWLKRLGYRPIKSGLKFNPEWSQERVDELSERVESEFEQSGLGVTLIGHSLGGLQARSAAQRIPNAIRHLITLGAPLMYASGSVPSTVPFISIHTARDLPYEPAAREAHARNVLIAGTHDLLGVNRRVYTLVAEALALGHKSPKHVTPP